MSDALREQLLKAGLADEKKLKQAKSEKHKQHKQQNKRKKSQRAPTDKPPVAASPVDAEKKAKDRALNMKQASKKAASARRGRIIDFLKANSVARKDGDVPFNFTHGKKIKKINLIKAQVNDLAAGKLGIVIWERHFHLLTKDKLEKFKEFAPELVVYEGSDNQDEDDAYKDHPIPDDLMW